MSHNAKLYLLNLWKQAYNTNRSKALTEARSMTGFELALSRQLRNYDVDTAFMKAVESVLP